LTDTFPMFPIVPDRSRSFPIVPDRSRSFTSFPIVQKDGVLVNIQKMVQQAKEMQDRLQKQMADMRMEATAGGGMVTVTITGHKQLVSITIDPEVVSKDDVEMLQDLIVAAVNDAHRKVDEALASQMQGMMGGMQLPGLS
jgi:DNA-binding YbaB/EbfC family protein